METHENWYLCGFRSIFKCRQERNTILTQVFALLKYISWLLCHLVCERFQVSDTIPWNVIFISVVYIFLRGCEHEYIQKNTVNPTWSWRDLATVWRQGLYRWCTCTEVSSIPSYDLQSNWASEEIGIFSQEVDQQAFLAGKVWDEAPGKGWILSWDQEKIGSSSL